MKTSFTPRNKFIKVKHLDDIKNGNYLWVTSTNIYLIFVIKVYDGNVQLMYEKNVFTYDWESLKNIIYYYNGEYHGSIRSF